MASLDPLNNKKWTSEHIHGPGLGLHRGSPMDPIYNTSAVALQQAPYCIHQSREFVGFECKPDFIGQDHQILRPAFHVHISTGAFQCAFPQKKKCISMHVETHLQNHRICLIVHMRVPSVWATCTWKSLVEQRFHAWVKYLQAETHSWKWWEITALEQLFCSQKGAHGKTAYGTQQEAHEHQKDTAAVYYLMISRFLAASWIPLFWWLWNSVDVIRPWHTKTLSTLDAWFCTLGNQTWETKETIGWCHGCRWQHRSWAGLCYTTHASIVCGNTCDQCSVATGSRLKSSMLQPKCHLGTLYQCVAFLDKYHLNEQPVDFIS